MTRYSAAIEAALTEFNRGVIRARNAYAFDNSATARDLARRESRRQCEQRRRDRKRVGK